MEIEEVLSNLEFIHDHSDMCYDYPCAVLTEMTDIRFFRNTIGEAIELLRMIRKVHDSPHNTPYCQEYAIRIEGGGKK